MHHAMRLSGTVMSRQSSNVAFLLSMSMHEALLAHGYAAVVARWLLRLSLI